MFGLRDTDITEIKEILERFPEVESARIFGSRAKGNYKNGSDVDIALFGKNINFNIVLDISSILNEESSMPYYFDVLDYKSIENKDLVHHIDRIGQLFFKNDNAIKRDWINADKKHF